MFEKVYMFIYPQQYVTDTGSVDTLKILISWKYMVAVEIGVISKVLTVHSASIQRKQ